MKMQGKITLTCQAIIFISSLHYFQTQIFFYCFLFCWTASQMDIYVNVLSVIDFQGKTIVVKYLMNFLDDFHKILQYTTYKT